MIIALASPIFPDSLETGITTVERFIKEAALRKAEIICFPESYLPGMRGLEFEIEPHSQERLKFALEKVCALALEHSINVIIPMDWDKDGNILNVAFVISDKGEVIGCQTKNQLDPSEDAIFIAGDTRSVFTINGTKIGLVICHEGFRYPESVRWAATRGAQLVFHPFCAGSDTDGDILTEWGAKDNPYYEKAMICRAMENNIFYASVNYSFKFPEAVSSVISPVGQCIAHSEFGKEDLLTIDIDLELATRELAKRFRPKSFQ
ncbi:carbon-nitrogen hydrolase family protein [Pedobacter kyonggii]|uniref:Carbon-nitrogen hydrolase family protein n=1 Tax=Pedobacter kyonggii TaxID=1926871 RepID=A0A4Q9HGC0_9SPHI|nr:carbon-nitrogen hydrolase family protein [Pedobacter kyonggii]TBO44294.1 carbon-nitrogen hydrolase family protein [Pedobacter kyonggii]